MLALLALRPLRAHNYAAITLGRHLQRVGEGWLIAFEPAEVKIDDDTGWHIRLSANTSASA